MMKNFCTDRRGAIAMMFALCLVPLVLLIGLAIDYSFYVQTSEQVSRAASAAATQAVRTAAADYALDIANNQSVTQATNDAKSYGQSAGQQWFAVQSSNLVRGTAGSPTVTVTPSVGANGGAGFSADVNYSFSYPPFFNTLFNRTTNWSYNNKASAQAANQYVEVLLLLDTSASMEIGANQTDIATLSNNSVCFPAIAGFSTFGLSSMFSGGTNFYPWTKYSAQMTADGDTVDFTKLYSSLAPAVLTYINPSNSPTDNSGSCNTAKGYGIAIGGNPASATAEPCALACHTSTSTVGGYFADSYGFARQLGVTLRLDVVLTAAEQVAQDLYSAEQSSGQFSLGVYQFNSDTSVMVDGGTNSEATTDLTTAKTTLQSYDYAYKGNNALLPVVLTSLNHNTNFPLAISRLTNGTGGIPKLGQVTNTQANPAGSTAANPIKNIFIVTDGFEDATNANGLSLDFGEMTSSTAEAYYTTNGTAYNGNATGYCSQLKQLGFNVYVLYVTYYPVPIIPYYESYWIGGQSNHADATDFPGFTYGSALIPRTLAEATSTAEALGSNPDPNVPATAGEVSPNEEALQACATNGDFYIASSAADITTAMSAMLKSAINSSIIVTK